MKKKVLSKKNIILALLLLIVLACTLLLAGCNNMISDEEFNDGGTSGGTGGGGSGDNGLGDITDEINTSNQYTYKLGYKTSASDNEVANDIAKLSSETLIPSFVSTYGYGSGVEGYQDIYYYDSIRWQFYEMYSEDMEAVGVFVKDTPSWNWSFPNTNIPISKYSPKAKSDFDGTDNNDNGYADTIKGNKSKYDDAFQNAYAPAMELVLYEILLGKDVENAIEISEYNSDNYPIIKYRGTTLNYTAEKLDTSVQLEALKTEYFDKATYFGFSTADINKLKDYILNHIIGSAAHTDKDGKDQLDDNRNYRKYVENLIAETFGENSKYNWYSRTAYIDEKLLITDGEDSMAPVVKREYSSLIFLSDEVDGFIGTDLLFESDRAMNIWVYTRYFNGNEIIETVPVKVELDGKTLDFFGDYNIIMGYGPESGHYDIDAFDNNEKVKAESEQTNSVLSGVYKPTQSINGFGSVNVFNEENVQSRFVEIVFDVEKSVNDPIGTDYGFKVALFCPCYTSDGFTN